MSGLNNMKARIAYHGGGNQKVRMQQDKLRSLRKALLYSYQSETLVLADGREFRCLINPNKLSMELDDKVLSVPFEDIRLNPETPKEELEDSRTSQNLEVIGVKPGDVITWKENNTHWLVYNQYLQETAYFRGAMRQCDTEVEIGGKRYWVYLKGPSEKGIDWKNKGFYFNTLNYTLEMYISNDFTTNEFFERFTKLKIQGKPWEVQAVDRMTTDGIIAVYLKEDFTNEFEDAAAQPEEPEETPDSGIEETLPHVAGPSTVYPFDIVTYSIKGASNGVWSLSNKRARILEQNDSSVQVEITSGRSGDVSLIYTFGAEEIVFNITISSL